MKLQAIKSFNHKELTSANDQNEFSAESFPVQLPDGNTANTWLELCEFLSGGHSDALLDYDIQNLCDNKCVLFSATKFVTQQ